MVALLEQEQNGEKMIDFKIEESGNNKTLIVNGELPISNAAAMQGGLIRSLESPEDLIIDLEEVSDVDLSFLQLLCSVHKTSRELNKHITMSGKCPQVFRDAVRKAGYLQQSGCRFNCDNICHEIEINRDSEKGSS